MNEARLRIVIAGETLRIETTTDVPREWLFRGKTPEAALRLIPLLFNLCPMAHGTAARIALGLQPPPDADLMLAREILTEHALVMLRDWPEALGFVAGRTSLVGLAHLSGDRLVQLEEDLFGMPAESFLAHDVLADLPRGTVALAALGAVAGWPADWGRTVADADPSILARCRQDEAISAAIARDGATLAVRMWARLREAARLIAELETGRYSRRYRRSEDGVAWVEAARGQLVHRATVANGLIRSYDIETPTSAMIAPGGFLERMLQSVLQAPDGLRDKALAIALSCADPCLAVEPIREAA
ncbi:Coenzyme F420-reducing hydrogenase, alpha subunit [Hartmannibacter diazotrophicus]|uniref:Coenzyme F420-reducing hydrogenase, alpha subunit n=1 Tax=Hartmannibacter diazotrophicus TaxID=1482074 RepID=A0A2C9D0V4_9HYPH|nr:uptake hydrogenase HoxC [Hartmannibacter diazotrophicus]SON53952.1 Coenzyme F420-reducing hydrogenase, alpha subunit [Hartmannibacter diazotrophicus]